MVELLLKTADAGRYLGVSVQSLRRYRDVEGGFLAEQNGQYGAAVVHTDCSTICA